MDSRLKTASLLAAGVIIPDQITKAVIQQKYALWETDPVIPGFFNMAHVLNKGAAFGFLNNPDSNWQVWFFVAVTVLAVGFISYLLATADPGDRFFIWGLGLVLGGALGNFIDRIRFGHVVDFLDFHVGGYHWPAFNVADIAITCGAFSVIVSMYMKNRREHKTETRRSGTGG
ncbi:signal peptidase II [Humidesulfovibrio mexicanus]|uniref:Lipoprotein signal peptidase n=1 Tax=Humidesulfovibrio mexicanus TaxID=147047 RepID=A0A238XUI0_9BACT|nr:signal peptidase II [Humidesulfovibrio mexicanus]SNR62655.1 signal peptidase II [Humidesulfovibrio mexicanus]